jgi:hypothetical protein
MNLRAGQPVTGEGLKLIRCYRFSATLQLRTPLKVLRMHGQELPADVAALPAPEELWHGIWLPVVKTWRELGGVDIPEFKPSTIATGIGALSPHDADALSQALIEIRQAAEGEASVAARRAKLRETVNALSRGDLVGRLGGRDCILDYFFPPFLSCVPAESAQYLRSRGISTAGAISALSDKQLLAVPGIGPKTLAHLRASCASAAHPDCAYVDAATAQNGAPN